MRFLLLALILAGAVHAAGIESFSPQGEVKGVRQVAVRFSDAMVPLGDPRLAEPFDIDCAEKGGGRWVDGKNWVYDFERDLPAGVQCAFTLKPGLKALDGIDLKPDRRSFTTGGPAILLSLPQEGDESIDEKQIFVLGLDAQAKSASLTNRVWCVADGVAEKIPARPVDAATRKTVLANSEYFFSEYLSLLDERGSRLMTLRLPGGTTKQKILATASADDAPVVVLQCARRLPAGARIKLLWGAGIESVSGVAASTPQTLEWKVRPAFSAKLRCDKLNAKAPCLPVLPMTLEFTAPVPLDLAARISLAGAGKTWKPEISEDDRSAGSTTSLSFKPPFPEAARLTLKLPAGFKDDAGRRLRNARKFPLAVKTDNAPPLAKFAAPFGLIESRANPMLPLTLRASGPLTQRHAALTGERLVTQKPLEVIAWLKRIRELEWTHYGERDDKLGYAPITGAGAEKSMFGPQHKIRAFRLPKPLPERATEVVGIPLKETGFHVVEVVSPRLGPALLARNKPYHVRAAALVTNMAVHFKQGGDASLVWVTALDSGKPLAEVAVAVRDCDGKIYSEGKTDRNGMLPIAQDLPDRNSLPGCLDRWDRQYYVTAYKDGDFSFVLGNWNEGISSWRFNLYQNGWQGPVIAHAVLDRSLFRAGETVGIKLFVRKKASNGFAFVDASQLGGEILLRHEGGGYDESGEQAANEDIKLPVQWSKQGIAEARFNIPEKAKQGMYTILIQQQVKGQTVELEAGSFRVAAYRVPSMRASLNGPATPAVNAEKIALDVQLGYLSGGAASFAPVKLRGQLQDKSVQFADYEDLHFANGEIKPGRGAAEQDWTIGNYDVDGEDGESAAQPQANVIKTQAFKLDAGGAARVEIPALPRSDTPRDLLAELEYRDANGETLTVASRIPLYPSQVLLAVKPDSWLLSQAGLKFTVQAVDVRGKAVAGLAIKTEILKREWTSYRKRLLGGFYAYENSQQTVRIGDACSGTTDDLGRLSCQMKAPATGDLVLQARAQDAAGNASVANAGTWVPGPDSWMPVTDNDRMDLVPEKRKVEIGETARLRMALPFETATVLVSVEREGVLDAWVTEVSRASPVIEVPIKPHYGPNVFVSALAVRGRIAGIAPSAMVDLGKPAFRMGMAEIKTGWSGHALDVKVTPDKLKYRVREQVKAKIRVTRPDGSPARKGEVAVAVVDEGLLELQANDSWKLLDAMMARRGIDVETSTAQMQVVGKRHYGRKAVAAGGGGGQQSARELFDTGVYWQAQVKLDEHGEAAISFPLNDSLSAFRIVAVASVNVGRFGTGEARIQSQQDLILQSGLAPVVREGDTYTAYFTLRNGAERSISSTVKVSVGGLPELDKQTLTLRAGEARELAFPVRIPHGVGKLAWEISASEGGKGGAQDRMKLSQRVIEAVPVRTFQATLMQLDKPIAMATRIPADAVPGRGGVGIKWQARLGSSLPGVTEYMSRYPWSCLEQQTSVAVALQDTARWNSVAARLSTYLDSDGLAKYWPDLREGSDTLTAYVLSIAHEADYSIADEPRARMLHGLTEFVEGRVVRGSVLATADLAVRKIAAMEAVSRYPEVEFKAEWLDSFSHTPNLWPTTTLLDWIAIHQRVDSLPGREARLDTAQAILKSRLNFSGTVMTFTTERSDTWWWLMWNTDVNANRLLLAANDDPAWRDDIGRLVRGSLSRLQRGSWHTTVANAWGVLAMKKFSATHEAVAVSGTSTATLAGKTAAVDWKQPTANSLLPWGSGAQSLQLQHSGAGKPWVTVSSLAAIPLKQPLNAGYRITRSIKPIEVKAPGSWHRGDVYRVSLTVDAQTDMGWVALSDPIPSGATILGTGLGRDSAILSGGETRQGWVWPAYEERTHDSFRAYYTWVPKGKFTVEYTVRLNNEGEFQLPAARVEAMYAPELFGEFPVATMRIKP